MSLKLSSVRLLHCSAVSVCLCTCVCFVCASVSTTPPPGYSVSSCFYKPQTRPGVCTILTFVQIVPYEGICVSLDTRTFCHCGDKTGCFLGDLRTFSAMFGVTTNEYSSDINLTDILRFAICKRDATECCFDQNQNPRAGEISRRVCGDQK